MIPATANLIQFFDGKKQCVIPVYQRPYSWAKKNWQSFWDDLLRAYKSGDGSAHFMGAIVSVPLSSSMVGVHKHLIIDGQQRLTTLALLLAALREYVPQFDQDAINDYLTNHRYTVDSDDYLKLLPTQVDQDFYRALVTRAPLPAATHRMKKCLEFFHKQIKGLKDDEYEVTPGGLFKCVESNLRVVGITLDAKDDDPYVIFESLNHKGEPLKQADLARNYVLMRFSNSDKKGGGEQKRIHDTWWRPLEKATKDNLTDFLRYRMEMDGEYIPAANVYAVLKRRMEKMTSGQVEEELKKLNSLAVWFSKFLEPKEIDSPSIKQRMLNLEALKVKTCYPLLLHLFDDLEAGKFTVDALAECLKLIESFIVRRSACGVPNNSLDQRFVQLCAEFQPGGGPSWLMDKLAAGDDRQRWPSDVEFENALLTQPQYGRLAARHILLSIEMSYKHKEPVKTEKLSVEHVMPQKLNAGWKEMLGKDDAKSIHERLLHTIGNLTLTGYNPELGNMAFDKKKEKFAKSHLELNVWIAGQEVWNEQVINDRARELAAKSLKLWPKPASALAQPA
jgi:uncharacterized protein with ParB-like and HNH nuclease domain